MVETGIYTKLDYYTAIWEGCSIRDIIEYLQLDYVHDEFFENSLRISHGYESYFVFSYQQIMIQIPHGVLCLHPNLEIDDTAILDFVFESLRVEIGGSALDNLRLLWAESGFEISVDTYLRTPFEPVRGRMHVTRCDFAFDLINYMPEFLDKVIDHLNSIDTQRVHIFCRQGGCAYSVRSGGHEKTVYLGSKSSPEMLRIYDKKLESTTEDGLWRKETPFNGCESWIRLELQCRRERAHGLCFGDGDEYSVFRYIYEHYAFRDVSFSSDTQKVLPFWIELFDWDNVPPIIQNLQFKEVVNVLERAEKYVLGTAFSSIAVLVAEYGFMGFVTRLRDELRRMQDPGEDQIAQRRWRSVLFKLKNIKGHNLISDLPGLTIKNNTVDFKF